MHRLDDDHDSKQCQNCGRHVTPSFVRVFGHDGSVDRCRGCDTVGRLMNGSAAGRHVGERTDPLVDTTRARDGTSGEPVLLADIHEGDA